MNVPAYSDPSVNDMMRSLQPNMVINNRGFDAGDFGTPEREYQQDETKRTRGFERPTEACNSVGTQSWGYRKDEDYYTSSFLIQSIAAMMAKGTHYLLNVGPDATGSMPDPASAILSEIGDWYRNVREAYSDTQPCPHVTRNQDVLLTRRGDVLYVHLKLPIKSDAIVLPPITELPAEAVLLNTGMPLACSIDVLPEYWRDNAHMLRIKGLKSNAPATSETLVIKLRFEHALPCSDLRVDAFEG